MEIVSLKRSSIGFVLALLFTIFAFVLMQLQDISNQFKFITLAVLAVMQIFVHLIYFLHLDQSHEKRWDVIAIVFTLILVVIFIGGTLWVIYSLNQRMM